MVMLQTKEGRSFPVKVGTTQVRRKSISRIGYDNTNSNGLRASVFDTTAARELRSDATSTMTQDSKTVEENHEESGVFP